MLGDHSSTAALALTLTLDCQPDFIDSASKGLAGGGMHFESVDEFQNIHA